MTKERDIARDIKALSDSEDRILKNYDAEVAKIREAAEATIARLKGALATILDDAVGANHEPLWIVRREFIDEARAALDSSEGTERQP